MDIRVVERYICIYHSLGKRPRSVFTNHSLEQSSSYSPAFLTLETVRSNKTSNSEVNVFVGLFVVFLNDEIMDINKMNALENR